MFQFIRKHQAIGLIFIGIVIVSFVIFFSPNQKLDQDRMMRGAYGTIGGEPIERDAYLTAMRESRLAHMLREGNWPTQNGRGWDQEQEVMNRLVLLREAQGLGIVVSDEAAASRILELPFLRDERAGGTFSRPAYDQFLALIQREDGMTRADFETFMRHEIAIQQLVQVGGMSGALVPPREAEARFRSGNDQYAGQLVVLSASNYVAQVNLSPTNVLQYYSNRLAEYRIPERAVVRYVKFAVTNFYAEADQAIAANTNFQAEVEAEYQRQGAEAFKDPANGNPMTPEAAKAEITSRYRKNRGLLLARTKANEFANRLYQLDAKLDSLNQLAAETGLTVQSSLPFDQFRPPFDMHVPATFNKAAFSLSFDEPFATPVVGDDGVYVFAFERRIPSEVQPFETVKERATESLKRTESRSLAERAGREFATKAAEAVAAGKTFAAAAAEAGLKAIVLTNFSRATPTLPELGPRLSVNELLRVAEDVPAGKVAPFAPAADGGYVLFVESRSSVPEEVVKKELPEFLTQARQYGRFAAFSEWEKRRFAAASVKVPGGERAGVTNSPAPVAQ